MEVEKTILIDQSYFILEDQEQPQTSEDKAKEFQEEFNDALRNSYEFNNLAFYEEKEEIAGKYLFDALLEYSLKGTLPSSEALDRFINPSAHEDEEQEQEQEQEQQETEEAPEEDSGDSGEDFLKDLWNLDSPEETSLINSQGPGNLMGESEGDSGDSGEESGEPQDNSGGGGGGSPEGDSEDSSDSDPNWSSSDEFGNQINTPGEYEIRSQGSETVRRTPGGSRRSFF